ncbi:MAG: hypothetical protein AB7I27_09260 [Bacteriovoracaceae bacterium]
MKVLFLGFLALFSVSSFAICPQVDTQLLNEKVNEQLMNSLMLDQKSVLSMKLVEMSNYYAHPGDACPATILYYHAFRTQRLQKECSVLTKFRMSFDREDINDFSILDIECR